MSPLRYLVSISVLSVALAACDAGGGASGGESTATAAGTGDAAQAEPAAATGAGVQPAECVSGLLQNSRFVGQWRVRQGEAQFGGHTTSQGTNTITLNDGGNSLTMTLEGFPTVRMQRVRRGEIDWNWPTGPNVDVSGEDVILVYGCANQDEMARFTGQARVNAEGMSAIATFKLLLTGPNDGILYWEMAAPMASSGLFNIERGG